MQPLRDIHKFRADNPKDRQKPSTFELKEGQKDADALLSILHSRRGLGATDPRDFIYAHLGMASQATQESIAIDYARSCSTIYIDFARQVLEWIPPLDIIQMVGNQNQIRLPDGLPSWIPDRAVSIQNLFPTKFVTGSESAPRTRHGFTYRPLHSDSTLLVVPVEYLGTVHFIIPSKPERKGESMEQTQNRMAVEFENWGSAAIGLSDEKSRYKENMLYFFNLMLERTFGTKERNRVFSANLEDGQNLNASRLSSPRKAVSIIQAVQNKPLESYEDSPWSSYPTMKDSFDLCTDLLRITRLYVWPTPSRKNFALLCGLLLKYRNTSP